MIKNIYGCLKQFDNLNRKSFNMYLLQSDTSSEEELLLNPFDFDIIVSLAWSEHVVF